MTQQAREVMRLEAVDFAYRTGPAWARSETSVLRDIDLVVREGQTLGLVGESGAGKSTLAKVMLGILSPTSGTVLFDGSLIPSNRRRLKGRMQVVPQNPVWSLNPAMKVRTSVSEPLRILGTRHGLTEAVASALHAVGLADNVSDRYPHELSGGQAQRVAIARALITRPALIVFDEAVSALDVSVQATVLNLIRDLQSERQFAAVFISHDLAVVQYVAHDVAVMQTGRIVETSSAATFYEAAQHEYSKALQSAR
jgi:ABC-type glutathione transport system ATPase component